MGRAPASAGSCISTVASATPSGKAAIPNAVHTKKYPTPTSAVSRPRRVSPVRPTAWRYRHSIGTKDGSIIATIITTHMPRNDAAAPGQVCPGISIHAIDIVQPPGIGISPIADMDAHQTIVIAALAAKSSAETPKKARGELRSETMRRELSARPVAPTTPTTGSAIIILGMAAPPDALLVATFGGAIDPLVHAPEAVQSPRIGGIGVVDNAVLEHERAHARPIARVGGRVGPACGRELSDRLRDRCRVHRVAAALVVVFYDPLALLLLGERDVEVEVEVAPERGHPGKRPPHPPLVRLHLH